MEIRQLIDFMGVLENLKCNTRHSWTSSGRQESVAEHSWRLAMMAYLLKDEFKDMDMDKIIKMCLVHDWGEAVTGDIPCFDKKDEDEKIEDQAIDMMLSILPGHISQELDELFTEMKNLSTPEARLVKALDKMEVVLQHNEADISTWLPLEYDLNVHHGEKEVAEFPYLIKLKKVLNDDSRYKIRESYENQEMMKSEAAE